MPLGEASERYLVELRAGAETLVSVETSSPAVELATPGVQGEVEIAVSQISERFGPGPAVRTTLAL